MKLIKINYCLIICLGILAISSKIFCMELKEIDHNYKKQFTFSTESLAFIALISNFYLYNNPDNDPLRGVWYPHDYIDKAPLYFKEVMYENFWSGYANRYFFNKKSFFEFEARKDKEPAKAIKAFLEGPTIADCGNFITALYYKTILDLIGKDKFNKKFKDLIITRLGITDSNTVMSQYSVHTPASENLQKGHVANRPLDLGDVCHFEGITWYPNKHAMGFDGGANVIYVGNNGKNKQLFLGHGFKNPTTEEEINQFFLERYNEPRTLQDEQFAEVLAQPLFMIQELMDI